MTTTTKEKAVNYSTDMIVILKEVYIPTDTQEQRIVAVKTLSKELERSEQSIRMKLTQLKLYVPMVQAKKIAKVKKPTRAELQTALERVLGFEVDTLAGFDRANASSLQRVIDRVNAILTPETTETTETTEEV